MACTRIRVVRRDLRLKDAERGGNTRVSFDNGMAAPRLVQVHAATGRSADRKRSTGSLHATHRWLDVPVKPARDFAIASKRRLRMLRCDLGEWISCGTRVRPRHLQVTSGEASGERQGVEERDRAIERESFALRFCSAQPYESVNRAQEQAMVLRTSSKA
jgi:hypothetical protein